MHPNPHVWFRLGIEAILALGLALTGIVLVLANVIEPHRVRGAWTDARLRAAGILLLLGALGIVIHMAFA
jgi:hypothetical protein